MREWIFRLAVGCLAVSNPVGAEDSAGPDRMLFLEMNPEVADALEQKFAAGTGEADDAMTRLDSLIRGRTVALNCEFDFDATSPERKWLKKRDVKKELEVMPGWMELVGEEMTHLYKEGQVLDFFAKVTRAEGREALLKELKVDVPAARGHFVYSRWDLGREESEVFLSRSAGAPMGKTILVRIAQYRFQTPEERENFLAKVSAADARLREKAATFLAGKAEFVQAVSVATALEHDVRMADRRPQAYEIGDEIYDSRDRGVRCDLSFETDESEGKKLNVFYLDAGLTGKKKEHETGERVPEFYSGHYSEKIDYSADQLYFTALFHSHLKTADLLMIRLVKCGE